MENQTAPTKQYLLTAIICGFAATLAYILATQAHFGLRTAVLIFMAFGPCFVAANLATYYYLKLHRDSLVLRIGTLFMMIAGGTVIIMAAMQGVLRTQFYSVPHDQSVSEATQTAWNMAYGSADALQLGVDVAWDVFLFAGMILLGLAFSRDPRIGRLLGWSAVLVGVAGMVLNGWAFPDTPAMVGLVDIGPITGLWSIALTIQLIRLLIKTHAQETNA